jgi:LAO/AO transport system kinase
MPHPQIPVAAVRRREPSLDELLAGVRAGDRALLGRAITLVESTRADHRALARELVARLLGEGGKALRIGITGVPGAGKSTFIEVFGRHLTAQGLRVAVLAVDPSSSRSGGSILGDKTRMSELSADPLAFIRPSPSGCALGGVARMTREAMVLVESAGYEVVLVETVGVGQSETVVAELVDSFVLLSLAGAGDELQGIKRGVLELAEILVVNKADGANTVAAERHAGELRGIVHCLRPPQAGWHVPVITASSLERRGMAEVEQAVRRHRAHQERDGGLARRRAGQRVSWLWSQIHDRLHERFRSHPSVAADLAAVEAAVEAGRLHPGAAADRLLAGFLNADQRTL